MNTRIHVSGLSYFAPMTSSVRPLSRLERWRWPKFSGMSGGHSLGLGIVHMARSEGIERVFNEQQRFEISGSCVDLWEPAEPEDPQAEQMVISDLRDTRAEQTGQATGQEKIQNAFQRMAVFGHRAAQTLLPTFWTVKHEHPYSRRRQSSSMF